MSIIIIKRVILSVTNADLFEIFFNKKKNWIQSNVF